MEKVTVQYSLAPYGIEQTIPLQVDRVVNGIDATTMEEFKPRNQVEINAIQTLASRMSIAKVQNLPQLQQLIEDRVHKVIVDHIDGELSDIRQYLLPDLGLWKLL